MPFARGLFVAILLATAAGCSSSPTIVEADKGITPVAADSYLAHKEKEIQRLERRIVDLDKLAANPQRKYQGSHDNLEQLIADQNRKLASAKMDLKSLKDEKGVDTIKRMTRLNDTLDDMRTTLNLMVAE